MSKKNWLLHTGDGKAAPQGVSDASGIRKTVPVPGQEGQSGGSAEGEGPTAELCATEVDLSGLMSVLGRHLYSTPVVALRELVQNAHDSIIRRRLEDPSAGGMPEEPLSLSPPHAHPAKNSGPMAGPLPGTPDGVEKEKRGRITVRGDTVKGIVSVTDTGAGLTDKEIRVYLATVGVGYTRILREREEDAGLIGMFGLGFLSAFVLATEVTVTTTSFQQPDIGWQYRSTTGEYYTLSRVPPRPVGTEVSLVLRDRYAHVASPEILRQILDRYCILLREPVYIGGSELPLNPERPPWREPGGNTAEHPVWLERKRLDFAKRFEEYFEPICTVPVTPLEHPGAGESDAVGLLWIQDGATYGTSDNRRLSVFGLGMLLDDDARDLLPSWAGFVSGVIESNLLTPTASREDLQRDEQYFAARYSIAESLISGLSRVAKSRPEAWRRVLNRHNEALLGAALCDDRLFELLADEVRIPTSQGDIPVRALKTEQGALHVMLGAQGGFEDMLFRVLRTPVARGDRYAVLPFLRKWVSTRGGTLVELGTAKGNRRLFTPESLPGEEQEWLASILGNGESVVPARFAPAELPMVVVPDREAELKRRLEQDEADKRISVAALRLARNFTAGIDVSVTARLYVNLDNPAVASLLCARKEGREWETKARLLKSLKIIMSAGDAFQESLDVNGALGEFSFTVSEL